jgi:protein kinase D
MEEAADYSEADKSSISDELEDSGVIPGSHSESALHASEEEEGEGHKAQRYCAQGPFRRLQAWASLSLRWANISV